MEKQKVTYSLELEAWLVDEARELFEDLGMSMETAINVFLRQAVRKYAFPFTPEQNHPNDETLAAIFEAERLSADPNAKRYDNVEDLIRELHEECEEEDRQEREQARGKSA